jgi:hypothetical protein
MGRSVYSAGCYSLSGICGIDNHAIAMIALYTFDIERL